MNEYVLEETCWCGASIRLENWHLPTTTKQLAKEWREGHKCKSDDKLIKTDPDELLLD